MTARWLWSGVGFTSVHTALVSTTDQRFPFRCDQIATNDAGTFVLPVNEARREIDVSRTRLSFTRDFCARTMTVLERGAAEDESPGSRAAFLHKLHFAMSTGVPENATQILSAENLTLVRSNLPNTLLSREKGKNVRSIRIAPTFFVHYHPALRGHRSSTKPVRQTGDDTPAARRNDKVQQPDGQRQTVSWRTIVLDARMCSE